jgi:hypothetical protein
MFKFEFEKKKKKMTKLKNPYPRSSGSGVHHRFSGLTVTERLHAAAAIATIQ